MGKIDATLAMAEFTDVILQGFRSIVPARFPDSASWRLEIAPGKDPFSADPDDRVVKASPRGLAAVWCMSAYAVRVSDCIRAAVANAPNKHVHDIGPEMAGWAMFVDYSIELKQGDVLWPCKMSRPNAASQDRFWATVNEVFLGAVTWLLLHEIGHVALKHDVNAPGTQKWKQEEQADAFATEETFKTLSVKDRVFWLTSVGAAFVWLLQFHSFADRTHPPGRTRIRNFLVSASIDAKKINDELALEMVCHLLKGTFLPTIQAPVFNSSDEFLKWLLERLREP